MRSRFFFITYAMANVGLVVYGLMALVKPEILLEPFLANVYQFPPEGINAVLYISGLYRLLGYFNIIPGALGLLILHRYWLTRGGWYLRIVIASTFLAYLGPVVFDNTIGTIGFFEILEHVIFVMILIAGLTMLVRGEEETHHGYSSVHSRNIPLEEVKS